MDRVKDQILPVVRTGMTGDLLTGAADDDLMDIATDPDFLMAEGDGHRVIIVPIPHKGRGTDPGGLSVTGVKQDGRQVCQHLPVTDKPLANTLAVAA